MSSKLYASNLSANGRKTLIINELANCQCEIIETNVYAGAGRSADYLRLNPLGKIPTLVDGDFVLTESNAIMIYLAQKANSFLYSENKSIQAKVQQWLFWEAAHWQPAISQTIGLHIGHILVPEYVDQPKESINWNNAEFLACIDYIESNLTENAFLVGDSLTLADIGVSAMMMYFNSVNFVWARYPKINQWFSWLKELPAWTSTKSNLWLD